MIFLCRVDVFENCTINSLSKTHGQSLLHLLHVYIANNDSKQTHGTFFLLMNIIIQYSLKKKKEQFSFVLEVWKQRSCNGNLQLFINFIKMWLVRLPPRKGEWAIRIGHALFMRVNELIRIGHELFMRNKKISKLAQGQ